MPVDPTTPPRRPAGYDDFVDQRIGKTRAAVKTADVATAAVTILVGLLALMLIAAAADHWLVTGGLDQAERYALWAIGLTGLGLYVATRLAPVLLRPINPLYAAQAIERETPQLKNSLLNALQLRDGGVRNPAIERAVQRQAAERLAAVGDAPIDHTPLVRSAKLLLAVVAAVGLYVVLSPKDFFASAGRVLAPWSQIAAPSRVRISDLTPGDALLDQGDRLQVAATVTGLAEGGTVELVYSTTDGRVVGRRVAMRSEGATRYLATLPPGSAAESALGVQNSLVYRIEAGDARSVRSRVTVRRAATIAPVRLRYEYPRYTGYPPRTVEGTGDLEAIEGTRVTLTAEANLPIESAQLDLGADGRPDARLRVDGRRAIGSLTLTRPSDSAGDYETSYTLRFTSTEGRANNAPPKYRVGVLADLPPEPAIRVPEEPVLEVALDQRVRIEAEGRDPDFRLAALRLVGEADGRRLLLVDLPIGEGRGAITASSTLTPREIGLQPGQTLTYWVEAADNRTPDPNTARSNSQQLRVLPEAEQGANRRDEDRQQRPGENGRQDPDPNAEQQPGNGPGQPNQSDPNQEPPNDEAGENADRQEREQRQLQKQRDQTESEDKDGEQDQRGNTPPGGLSGPGEEDSQSGGEDDNGGAGSEGRPGAEQPPGDPEAGGSQNGGQGGGNDSAGEQGGEDQGAGGGNREATESGDEGQGGGGEEAQPVKPDGSDDGSAFERLKKFFENQPKPQESDDTSASEGEPREGEDSAGERSTENNQGDGPSREGAENPQTRRRDGDPGVQPERPEGGPGPGEQDRQGEQSDSRNSDPGGETPPGQPTDRTEAPREGAGSSGQNQAADQGTGQAGDRGAGDSSGRPGEQQQADRPTGESGGQRPGEGSQSQDGGQQQPGEEAGGDGSEPSSRGDENGPKEGSPQGEEQGDQRNGQPGDASPSDGDTQKPSKLEDQRGQGPSDNSGESGQEPGKPSAIGDRGPGDDSPGEGTEIGADDANLDYARKQTELVLERLEKQLAEREVDRKLLDKLGWTEDDLRRFVERWRGMQREATQPGNNAGQTKLDRALRSLGPLDRPTATRKLSDDQLRDLRERARTKTPTRLLERLRNYSQSLNALSDPPADK